MEQLSLRAANKLIRKLRVRDGDILLIKLGSSMAEKQNIENLSNALVRLGHRKTLVIVAENPDDLTVLDAIEMNKQGWYHIEALGNRIVKSNKETVDAESGSPDI